MHFVNINFLPPRPDGRELENSYINLIILLAFYKLIDKAIALKTKEIVDCEGKY